MHAFMPSILVGPPRLDELRQDAQCTHQAESLESRAKVVVANGPPLSVRTRVGRPYS